MYIIIELRHCSYYYIKKYKNEKNYEKIMKNYVNYIFIVL